MWVVTRIYRIDYTKPVTEIRARLESVRAGYLRAGNLIGFVWWLMWIPVTVAIGFDAVLHPYSLVPSLIIGIVGWGVSLWLIRRVSRSDSPSAETWKRKLAGNSIKSAFLALEEIESAHIR